MEDDKKLEFFSDIKEKFFVVLAGIISLTTFIPAFLNKTSSIFGLNIHAGFNVFVAIYFILPFVFYLIYCSIHDYVGFLRLLPHKMLNAIEFIKISWVKHLIKIAIELAIALLAYLFLVSTCRIFNIVFTVLIGVAAIACFLYYLISNLKKADMWATLTEFALTATVIAAAFLFFLTGKLKKPENEKITFGYSTEVREAAFSAFEYKDTLKKSYVDVLDSVKRDIYKSSMRVRVLNQEKPKAQAPYKKKADSTTTDTTINDAFGYLAKKLDSIYRDSCLCEKQLNPAKKAAFRKCAIKIRDSTDCLSQKKENLKKVLSIEDRFYYLYNYSLLVQKRKTEQVSEKWKGLIKNLQYKSLAWFAFLLIMSLCLWFKLQLKLKSLSNKENKEIPLLTDDLSQVKSLIFLLFVLIIPWFREIETKDIELDKPFLNLSLTNLANGEYHAEPAVNMQYAPNYHLYLDTLTDSPKPDENVLRIMNRLDKLADSTIPNADDLDDYNDTKDSLYKKQGTQP